MLFFLTLLVYTVPHIMVFGAVNSVDLLNKTPCDCPYDLGNGFTLSLGGVQKV